MSDLLRIVSLGVRDSITCPVCKLTSYHTGDVRMGYCGNCHAFTSSTPVSDWSDDEWIKTMKAFDAATRIGEAEAAVFRWRQDAKAPPDTAPPEGNAGCE